METKKCFKCGRVLPLDQFYRHSMMADGHLNKCKECTKNDVHKKYMENILRPEYVEKERARGREKYKRLGYVSRTNAHGENRNTRSFLKARGIDLSGREAHHWNYNRPTDVFILDRREHKYIHKFLTFDKESGMFLYNGMLLDSKDKHREFLRSALKDRVDSITEYDFE